MPIPSTLLRRLYRFFSFSPAIYFGIAVCLGCSDDPSTTPSAGANRDAPAEVEPLYDSGTSEDELDQGTVQDHDTDTTSDPAPDRILRHGVVGTVTCITDGDTVHVTVDGWYHRVRLKGINAPECHKSLQNTPDGNQYVCSSDQEYWGLNSALALTDFALGEEVTVYCERQPGQACETDYYDRFLAYLQTSQGDLGEYQTRNGHALAFTSYEADRLATYCEAEFLAIDEELGMWGLGDRSEVLSRMNENTQDWYEHHDEVCAEVTR